MSNADLSEADLRGAILGDANLRGADLTGADLRLATIGWGFSNLEGANLSNAKILGLEIATPPYSAEIPVVGTAPIGNPGSVDLNVMSVPSGCYVVGWHWTPGLLHYGPYEVPCP